MSTNNSPVTIDVLGQSHRECDRLARACVVSTEGFNTSRVAASLKDAFRFLTTWDYSKPEVLNDRQVEQRLKRVDYTDIMDLEISKPVSFQGNLNDYLNEVSIQRLPYLTELSKTLLVWERALGQYLDHLEDLQERRPTPINSGFQLIDLNGLIEHEAAWLVQGNRSTSARFGDLFNNKRECVEAMQTLNKINAIRWTDDARPDVVASRAKNLNTVATALINEIENRQHKLSPKVEVQISDVLTRAARWVEFYSVMLTRILDTTSALKQTEKKLLRVL